MLDRILVANTNSISLARFIIRWVDLDTPRSTMFVYVLTNDILLFTKDMQRLEEFYFNLDMMLLPNILLGTPYTPYVHDSVPQSLYPWVKSGDHNVGTNFISLFFFGLLNWSNASLQMAGSNKLKTFQVVRMLLFYYIWPSLSWWNQAMWITYWEFFKSVVIMGEYDVVHGI